MTTRDFDNIAVKNQLGRPDDLALFGPFKSTDDLILEDMPDIVVKYDMTGASIWGKAVWGTDDWEGPYDYESEETVELITNLNDTFKWNFQTELTRDAKGRMATYGLTDTANSTATEDILTNNRVDFTSGQVWTSTSAFKDIRTNATPRIITSAALNLEASGTFTFEMSANGGVDWEEVSLNTEHIFTDTGSDLRIKVTETGASTGWIKRINLKYT